MSFNSSQRHVPTFPDVRGHYFREAPLGHGPCQTARIINELQVKSVNVIVNGETREVPRSVQELLVCPFHISACQRVIGPRKLNQQGPPRCGRP